MQLLSPVDQSDVFRRTAEMCLRKSPYFAAMRPDSLPEAMKTADTAKQRILYQPHLTMQRVWCEFEQGRLFLRGQVPSFYFKQLAQEAVTGIEGVRQVVNEIEVVW
jgi:osmotically-inducible protein OsmY